MCVSQPATATLLRSPALIAVMLLSSLSLPQGV
jgi:hypothetical protein